MGLEEVATEVFRNSWYFYQTALQGDYLNHTILYQPLQDGMRTKKDFRLLDLGCGDSDYFCRALEKCGACDLLSEYTGVDMSDAALKLGLDNLKRVVRPGGEIKQVTEDMTVFVKGATSNYDIILVSFALHHLPLEQKDEFLSDVRHLLAPGGELYVIDIFKREGESPEDYRTRQLADVQDNWKLLCDVGRSSLMNHITTCDLPETFSTYQDIALKKGYTDVKCLCTTPDELAKCVVLCA